MSPASGPLARARRPTRACRATPPHDRHQPSTSPRVGARCRCVRSDGGPERRGHGGRCTSQSGGRLGTAGRYARSDRIGTGTDACRVGRHPRALSYACGRAARSRPGSRSSCRASRSRSVDRACGACACERRSQICFGRYAGSGSRPRRPAGRSTRGIGHACCYAGVRCACCTRSRFTRDFGSCCADTCCAGDVLEAQALHVANVVGAIEGACRPRRCQRVPGDARAPRRGGWGGLFF